MDKRPTAKPATTNEYLAQLSREKRATLEAVRAAIKAAIPSAEECISYGIPAFRYQGRVMMHFAAAANHCSVFPGAFPIELHRADLAAYSTSKGTVRFPIGTPLPAALVKKLVKARLVEFALKKPVKTRPVKKQVGRLRA